MLFKRPKIQLGKRTDSHDPKERIQTLQIEIEDLQTKNKGLEKDS